MKLLFSEPQQLQEGYRFISTSFQPEVYATVTSMIEYGPNCQALDTPTTIVGHNNVTILTFAVSITGKICFIVTINNTFHTIAIFGSFTDETSISSGNPTRSELMPLYIIRSGTYDSTTSDAITPGSHSPSSIALIIVSVFLVVVIIVVVVAFCVWKCWNYLRNPVDSDRN